MNKLLYIRLLESEVDRQEKKIWYLEAQVSNLQDQLDPTRVAMRDLGRKMEAEMFNGIEGTLEKSPEREPIPGGKL